MHDFPIRSGSFRALVHVGDEVFNLQEESNVSVEVIVVFVQLA